MLFIWQIFDEGLGLGNLLYILIVFFLFFEDLKDIVNFFADLLPACLDLLFDLFKDDPI